MNDLEFVNFHIKCEHYDHVSINYEEKSIMEQAPDVPNGTSDA